jgi:predicted transcriptional regulator
LAQAGEREVTTTSLSRVTGLNRSSLNTAIYRLLCRNLIGRRATGRPGGCGARYFLQP